MITEHSALSTQHSTLSTQHSLSGTYTKVKPKFSPNLRIGINCRNLEYLDIIWLIVE
ncbi:hypothetical protein [Nostoc sp. CMAA1605]|uniref:hypothetical protein n=1 Tax=Nostoc sp. CMAA1605 TaxID=2055159 RepID=UPI001F256D62|nr:hypothetical protein [Nostoc sp. CMAA1605]